MAKARILVVDDEVDLCDALTMRFEANDYKVLKAIDGQTALELAQREMPDLIILDVMLPKLDGYKICRMLKFDDKYKHISIILFSAKALDSDKDTGMEVGADAYITKPFEASVLLAKVEELLKSKN